MRAISSAYHLSLESNQSLVVEWILNGDLNSSFIDLFEPIEGVRIVTNPLNGLYSFARNLKNRFSLKPERRVTNQEIYSSIRKGWSKIDFKNHFLSLLQSQTIEIETDLNFYPSEFNNYSIFKPIQDIRNTINSITSQYHSVCFGIHIRRGDHQVAIDESPVELFIEAMKKEKMISPGAKFFLATDSIEAQNALVREFGTDIVTFSRIKRRDTTAGVREALIDLYCLASTRKIIGSYWSSFSETASLIYNVPLVVVKR